MTYYKLIYLNYWGEVCEVYQEDKEDAERCKRLIEETGLKVLGIFKTKHKKNWRFETRKNRATI